MLDSRNTLCSPGHEVFTTDASARKRNNLPSPHKIHNGAGGYNAKTCAWSSTAVMREAENRLFVIDQLKIHNNLHLKFWNTAKKAHLLPRLSGF